MHPRGPAPPWASPGGTSPREEVLSRARSHETPRPRAEPPHPFAPALSETRSSSVSSASTRSLRYRHNPYSAQPYFTEAPSPLPPPPLPLLPTSAGAEDTAGSHPVRSSTTVGTPVFYSCVGLSSYGSSAPGGRPVARSETESETGTDAPSYRADTLIGQGKGSASWQHPFTRESPSASQCPSRLTAHGWRSSFSQGELQKAQPPMPTGGSPGVSFLEAPVGGSLNTMTDSPPPPPMPNRGHAHRPTVGFMDGSVSTGHPPRSVTSIIPSHVSPNGASTGGGATAAEAGGWPPGTNAAPGGTTRPDLASMSPSEKKKRSRRRRKLPAMPDLPPCMQLSFLPPPPPPLSLTVLPGGCPPHATTTAAAGQARGRRACVPYETYCGMLRRWYERVLAAEIDYLVAPPRNPPQGGSSGGGEVLVACPRAGYYFEKSSALASVMSEPTPSPEPPRGGGSETDSIAHAPSREASRVSTRWVDVNSLARFAHDLSSWWMTYVRPHTSVPRHTSPLVLALPPPSYEQSLFSNNTAAYAAALHTSTVGCVHGMPAPSSANLAGILPPPSYCIFNLSGNFSETGYEHACATQGPGGCILGPHVAPPMPSPWWYSPPS